MRRFLAAGLILAGACHGTADTTPLFLYEFSPEAPLADSRGELPELKLLPPATTSEDGKEGGGLHIPGPISPSDSGNCVELPASVVEQFPREKFFVEFDFAPGEALFDADTKRGAYLLDQMYSSASGIQITYDRTRKTLSGRVGNGNTVLSVTSPPLEWTAGQGQHIRLSYDAVMGELLLFVNGVEAASTLDSAFGAIAFGKRPLRLGNRLGSLYGNAAGTFDNFRAGSSARK